MENIGFFRGKNNKNGFAVIPDVQLILYYPDNLEAWETPFRLPPHISTLSNILRSQGHLERSVLISHFVLENKKQMV